MAQVTVLLWWDQNLRFMPPQVLLTSQRHGNPHHQYGLMEFLHSFDLGKWLEEKSTNKIVNNAYGTSHTTWSTLHQYYYTTHLLVSPWGSVQLCEFHYQPSVYRIHNFLPYRYLHISQQIANLHQLIWQTNLNIVPGMSPISFRVKVTKSNLQRKLINHNTGWTL